MRITDVTAQPLAAIPLVEVSGLGVGRNPDGRMTVVAIGDHAATIAWAEAESGAAHLDWQTLDLRHARGTRIPAKDPQLEAVAVDGAFGVLLVQEQPCRAEYIDARARRVLAHIRLDIPEGSGPSTLRDSWNDPQGSHAEGVVLLRDGRLLIVKEKNPAALLEFGPAGAAPRGFGADRWLAPGQPWWEAAERQAAGGDTPVNGGAEPDDAVELALSLLAAWAPTDAMSRACPDLSDAEVGPRGNLVLLSDKGRSVAVVPAAQPAADPFGGEFEATMLWRLSGIKDKPEGIVVLPELDVLVACDRRKVKKNLFLIPHEVWDHN